MNTMNISTYGLKYGYIYSNLKNRWGNLWKFTKCLLYATRVFCWEKISTFGIPKSTVLVIIFRVFIWLLSFKNAEKKHYPFADIRDGIKKKGQDHLIMKWWTMELLRSLLIMKGHPNLRNVLGGISMPNSTYLWRQDVIIL